MWKVEVEVQVFGFRSNIIIKRDREFREQAESGEGGGHVGDLSVNNLVFQFKWKLLVKSYSMVGMTAWMNLRKTSRYMCTPKSLPPSETTSISFFITWACLGDNYKKLQYSWKMTHLHGWTLHCLLDSDVCCSKVTVLLACSCEISSYICSIVNGIPSSLYPLSHSLRDTFYWLLRYFIKLT